MKRSVLCIMILFFAAEALRAEILVNIQGGAVFAGYNDVRIPGNYGSRLSLSNFSPDYTGAVRGELGYIFSKNHYVGALAAPLRIRSAGRAGRDMIFAGNFFYAGERIQTLFRFDSYRLTYRYSLVDNDSLYLGIGFTGKIRDASIEVKAPFRHARKLNTGFVPIINFRAEWKFLPAVSLLVAGDALAAPQGRAEDVLAGFLFPVSEGLRLLLGYRILEGGADNKTVYTFSLFHYAVAGLEARW